MQRTAELLSPAGNWACARAAVAAGADAIFFGLPKFNARIRAENFTEEDLPELMEFLHAHGVRGFVAMNTLIFTSEIEAAADQLRFLQDAGVDAIIVQDFGLAKMARTVAPALELHASTQMTITSPEGLAFAHEHLHFDQAVLARELSLKELTRFTAEDPPLEVFVHGALCVAYSGQCLTSESLGQRSANRGECAQACRMPYALIVDGEEKTLGDKSYLLSPQDLAAVDIIPDLLEKGVFSFKIEGRLKSPEYVTAVTSVYRKAIDAALANAPAKASKEDRYALEMTFSRGLSTGWFEGTDHPRLTHGRYGKKRGAFVGKVSVAGQSWVDVPSPETPLKPGDGIVFDTGGNPDYEQGGRIFSVKGDRITLDRYSKVETHHIPVGARVWKTNDPVLDKALRKAANQKPEPKRDGLTFKVSGAAGKPLTLEIVGTSVSVDSQESLEPAESRPLDTELLTKQLGRLGSTPYSLAHLENAIEGEVILPVSALNRLRRAAIEQLESAQPTKKAHLRIPYETLLPEHPSPGASEAQLTVLCRNEDQLDAAISAGVKTIYLDFEDIRKYKDVTSKEVPGKLFLATPRIQKSGEEGYFKLIERAEPTGVLVRNLGGVAYFKDHPTLETVGDFSLNVANPITARFYKEAAKLGHVTVSYDLNIAQVLDLLDAAPPEWFELTIHQHMPMFHMEHCVFCTFMSDGHDYTDCGRPCEKHKVQLRDRVGQLHTLQADVGCRNTLYRGQAQTGARYFSELAATGLSRFRLELLDETPDAASDLIMTYQRLISGEKIGADLHEDLDAESKLGVIEGTLTV